MGNSKNLKLKMTEKTSLKEWVLFSFPIFFSGMGILAAIAISLAGVVGYFKYWPNFDLITLLFSFLVLEYSIFTIFVIYKGILHRKTNWQIIGVILAFGVWPITYYLSVYVMATIGSLK